MSRSQLVKFLVVPLLLIGMTYALISSRTGGLIGKAVELPVLRCPGEVDVGEQENGENFAAKFTIENKGANDLHISNIRTQCSCSGLELIVDGKPKRIRELTLEPGKSQEVMLRLFVTEPAGSMQRNGIYFDTNDPHHPEHGVFVKIPKVTGGVSATPAAVTFGAYNPKTSKQYVIEVKDAGITKRSIVKVESSHPSRFTVHLKANTREKEASNSDNTIGMILVTPAVSATDTLDGNVIIYLDDSGKKPLVVPVSGFVKRLVHITPAEIVLPRMSDNGLIFFAECSCYTSDDAKLHIEAIDVPKGIALTLHPDQVQMNKAILKINCDFKELEKWPVNSSVQIRLSAVVGEQKANLEVTVKRRPF